MEVTTNPAETMVMHCNGSPPNLTALFHRIHHYDLAKGGDLALACLRLLGTVMFPSETETVTTVVSQTRQAWVKEDNNLSCAQCQHVAQYTMVRRNGRRTRIGLCSRCWASVEQRD